MKSALGNTNLENQLEIAENIYSFGKKTIAEFFVTAPNLTF